MLEDSLKEMEETQSLIIRIPLDELGTFQSECEEDGSYDKASIEEEVLTIGEAQKTEYQEAFDVLHNQYGQYLWFDHLVILIDAEGTYDEEENRISWTADGAIGLPTDLTFDEIEDKLEVIMSALANNGFVISYGELIGYTGSATSITIPAGVNSISSKAFRHNTTLTSVSIPGTVKILREDAFVGCTSLSKVTLAEGITTIRFGAFDGCTSLKSIVIPSTVTELGNYICGGCTSLTSATVNYQVSSSMFRECTSLSNVKLMNTVTEIGIDAFRGCSSLTKIAIPSGVKRIDAEAFFKDSALKELDLTNSSNLTSIGNFAFYGCTGLKSVTLPKSLTTLGQHAFEKCDSLSSVSIQSTAIDAIGEYAFANCTGLKNVVLGKGISGISSYMFYRCSALQSVSIPETVTEIRKYAFAECDNLTKVVIPVSVTTIDENAFSKTNNLTIYGYAGSTAESFANSHNIPFYNMSEDVQKFVIRIYESVLGRTPDNSGLTYWANELINGKKTGATVVANVIFGSEYTKKNVSDEEFIKTLYRAMMGREADNGGLKSWKEYLDNGVSREYVFRRFVLSSEFKNICATYGITQGTYTLKQNRDKNYKVTQFVNRCYTQALGRKGDASGLNSWTGTLLTKKKTPKVVAKNFVFSGEATKKNLNNTEFVKMLYRLYMGREADNGGLKYWVGLLDKGTSRQKVNDSMAGSKEFTEIVKSYGL
jgi:hypothetical protein